MAGYCGVDGNSDDSLDNVRFSLGRVSDRPLIDALSSGSQRGGDNLFAAKNVRHRYVSGEKVVGNDASVATPPERFGAHDRARAQIR
jgi:hypothetical protein